MFRHAFLLLAVLLGPLSSAWPARVDAAPPGSPPEAAALSHYLAGRMLEEEGDLAGALAEYFRALALDPAASGVARRAGELAGRLGEHRRALELADRALESAPDDARTHWIRGGALFSLERHADALAALERAVTLDSLEVEYWRSLGRVAETLNDMPRVVRAWRMVSWLEPEDAEAWFQLAAGEVRLGRYGAADTALAEAAELNPDRPGTWFLRGWVDEGLGRPKQAIEEYRRHLEIHLADQVTRQRLVRLLAAEKRWSEAWEEARLVTAARPDDPEAIEVEAELALRARRTREANALLERLHRDGRAELGAVERAIGVLARNARGAEAARLAARWSERNPGDPRGVLLAARAWSTAGDSVRAMAEARRAVAMSPDSLAPRVMLGRLLDDAGRHEEAEAEWVEAARRFPDQLGVQLALAQARERRGDVDGAVRAARTALERHPDSAPAMNTLGYLLADHGRSLEEAERLIARALEQEPDNGAYVDSHGWLQYRLGRLFEARRSLERAVDLTGGDPVVLEHLADVYKDLKLTDLAREHYRRSLEAGGDSLRVNRKLESLR